MADELVRVEAMRQLTIGEGRRRIRASLTPAAAAVAMTWDGNQRRRAGHESSHICCAASLGVRVTGVSIRGAHSAWTALGEPDADDLPEWRTATDLTSLMVVLLAGRAFDTRIFGEPTTGSEHDIREATRIAADMWDSAMLPGQLVVSRSGSVWGFGGMPRRIETEVVESVIAEVGRASARAEELVDELRGPITIVASEIYRRRKMTDRECHAVLRRAGMHPAPLGE